MFDKLYYSYGSNLNLDRFGFRLSGQFEKLCNYTIKDWKLVFGTGRCQDQSCANIIPCKGEEVEGVIYKIDQKGVDQLDVYEGVWLGTYRKAYFLYRKERVLVYIGVAESSAPPSLTYLNTIIHGCADHGLIRTQTQLEKIYRKFKKQQIYASQF